MGFGKCLQFQFFGGDKCGSDKLVEDKVQVTNQTFIFHHKRGGFNKTFQDLYVPGRKLKNFPHVYSCVHKSSGETRTAKILPRGYVNDEIMLTEIAILKELDHPNLLNIFESFEDDGLFYVVTDNLNHPNIFEMAATFGKAFGTPNVANIVLTLLRCLSYCHNRTLPDGRKVSVVHGAIKPQNILVPKDAKRFDKLLLVNFSSALAAPWEPKLQKSLDKKKKKRQQTKEREDATETESASSSDSDEESSSSEEEEEAPKVARKKKKKKISRFESPEMAETGPTVAGDIWAVGVLAFVLLTGKYPFSNIEACKLPIQEWYGITDAAEKDFIQQMLQLDPADRPSANELLKHEWLAQTANVDNHVSSLQEDPDILERLTQLSQQHKLQIAVRNYIATNMLWKVDREGLDEQFRAMDSNGDGVLSSEEIRKAMQKNNVILGDEEFEQFFKKIDLDGTGVVSYSEFITAATMEQDMLSEDNLKAAFKAMDRCNTDTISAHDLQMFFRGSAAATGETYVSTKVWKAIIKKCDSDGDNEISYEEFKDMMLGSAESFWKKKEARLTLTKADLEYWDYHERKLIRGSYHH